MNKVLKFPLHLASKLEEKLQQLGFEKEENPNAVFCFRGKDLKVVFYPTGTFLVQGKGDAQGLIEKLVEDLSVESNYIGTDEAGKGDLFGPLVVCGFALTPKVAKEVLKLGVRDSKSVPSESLKEIAQKLMELNCHRCVKINPYAYNEIYRKLQNLNKILSLARGCYRPIVFGIRTFQGYRGQVYEGKLYRLLLKFPRRCDRGNQGGKPLGGSLCFHFSPLPLP